MTNSNRVLSARRKSQIEQIQGFLINIELAMLIFAYLYSCYCICMFVGSDKSDAIYYGISFIIVNIIIFRGERSLQDILEKCPE